MTRLIKRIRRPTTTKRKQRQRFRFLDLPAELRQQIYRELLCSNHVYKPASRDGLARRYEYQIAILRCNKKINAEATPILYRNNCLLFFELDWRCDDEILRSRVQNLSKGQLMNDHAAVTLRKNASVCIQVASTPFQPSITQEKSRFVITFWELHMVAQRLWICLQTGDVLGIWSCDLRFQLSFKYRDYRNGLVDGLLGLRGPRLLLRTEITGIHPSISGLMSRTFRRRLLYMRDCIARASTFESRADDFLESGHSYWRISCLQELQRRGSIFEWYLPAEKLASTFRLVQKGRTGTTESDAVMDELRLYIVPYQQRTIGPRTGSPQSMRSSMAIDAHCNTHKVEMLLWPRDDGAWIRIASSILLHARFARPSWLLYGTSVSRRIRTTHPIHGPGER